MGKIGKNVMLNPESVILNLVQNLFRAGLFQQLTNQHVIRLVGFAEADETLKQVQGDKKQICAAGSKQ